MKKSLIALVLALALAVGGWGAVQHRLMESARSLTFAPDAPAMQQLTQDPGLTWAQPGDLSGLELTLRAQCEDRLTWDVTTRPAVPQPQVHTEFRLHPRRVEPPIPPERTASARMEFWLASDFSMTVSGGGLEQDECFGMSRLVEQAARGVGPGQTRSVVLDVSQSYTHWPLALSLQLPGGWVEEGGPAGAADPQREEQLLALAQGLRQAFRFPVQPGSRLEVTVRRDEGGTLVDAAVCSAPVEERSADAGSQAPAVEAAPTPEIFFWSVCADGWLWLVPVARQADGSLMDYRETPAGYGLYRLPIGTEQALPTVEQLEFVCPLDPGEKIEYLVADRQGRRLLALVQGPQTARVLVWDMDGRLIQQLELPPQVRAEDFCILVQGQGCWVIFWDGGEPQRRSHLCLLQDDGRLQARFTGDLPAGELWQDLPYSVDDPALAFDGERLALAGRMGHYYQGRVGWLALCYTERGLVWGDARSCPLEVANPGDSRFQCNVPWGGIGLRWV